MGTKEVLVTKFRKHAFPGYTEMHMYPKKKKSRAAFATRTVFYFFRKIPNMRLSIFEQ